ncbi:MAG: biopolymer transporter ExbD [Treponema sp.]|nr:biopolymer transporter ExbD [Treponema sp.]
MKLKRKKKSLFVPLFSTSDIAFLLLIFIMLVSLINYRPEIRIDFPEAETALRVSDENNLEIWVDRLGTIYLNGRPSDLLSVEQGIVDAYLQAPAVRVHIIADRYTAFENVHAILEILQLLQYRVVSFVVKNE